MDGIRILLGVRDDVQVESMEVSSPEIKENSVLNVRAKGWDEYQEHEIMDTVRNLIGVREAATNPRARSFGFNHNL